jgi:BirA family transcriptional regulator, biotin operon repressor / biotin---[acetyl-CoA-carboxylase] ligase
MAIWPELSLVAGAAVASALRAATSLDASVGHPNDVLLRGRKVAGILAEASPGRVALGFGVNVNQSPEELPTDTPKPPTSLRIELGRELERAPLLAAILLELEQGYVAWTSLNAR